MTPLEAILVPVALAAPILWLMHLEMDRLASPDYLRRHGVVIVKESALENFAQPIGHYMSKTVWGTVTFKGIVYRFDHVTRPERRETIGPGQLYLDPGLVYIIP